MREKTNNKSGTSVYDDDIPTPNNFPRQERQQQAQQQQSAEIQLPSPLSESSSSLPVVDVPQLSQPPPKKVIQSSSLNGAMAGTGLSSSQEAFIGLASGLVFGFVSPVIGHPFDTVKTRMQADVQYQQMNVKRTIYHIYHNEGIVHGFYRGFIPPLIGSMMFRGLQFSVYAGSYSAYEQKSHFLPTEPIPYTGGLRPSVLFGSFMAALVRSVIESPLDYIKVRRMVGKNVMSSSTNNNNVTSTQVVDTTIHQTQHNRLSQLLGTEGIGGGGTTILSTIRQLYRGFVPTLLRTYGLLGSFFVMVDYSVRYIPDIVNAPIYGPFFKGGICATCAWVFAFPFETAKNIIQANSLNTSSTSSTSTTSQTNTNNLKNMNMNSNSIGTTFKVIYELYKEKGLVHGVYRGFGPGASRSFIANGTSMIVFAYVQEFIRTHVVK